MPPVATNTTATINPHQGIINTINIPHPPENNAKPNRRFWGTPPNRLPIHSTSFFLLLLYYTEKVKGIRKLYYKINI